MSYKIEWGNKRVCIKYEGKINIKDLFTVSGKIINDSNYVLLDAIISDFQDLKRFTLSEKDIQEMTTLHAIPSILNPNIKFSIVSNNPDIQEMVLQYINLMKVNEWKIKLFDNLEESIEWCNQK